MGQMFLSFLVVVDVDNEGGFGLGIRSDFGLELDLEGDFGFFSLFVSARFPVSCSGGVMLLGKGGGFGRLNAETLNLNCFDFGLCLIGVKGGSSASFEALRPLSEAGGALFKRF